MAESATTRVSLQYGTYRLHRRCNGCRYSYTSDDSRPATAPGSWVTQWELINKWFPTYLLKSFVLFPLCFVSQLQSCFHTDLFTLTTLQDCGSSPRKITYFLYSAFLLGQTFFTFALACFTLLFAKRNDCFHIIRKPPSIVVSTCTSPHNNKHFLYASRFFSPYSLWEKYFRVGRFHMRECV